jgi:hypothetical protein
MLSQLERVEHAYGIASARRTAPIRLPGPRDGGTAADQALERGMREVARILVPGFRLSS